ncbi:uncharacterized protein LOC142167112 [Nicotiana tabacum]|uniref:Uncharacterized protein LOC142167112 n=1 Tax=Nicotiana tabacum TaxID=4097 RepID=A0AC58SEJ3_TOBAC
MAEDLELWDVICDGPFVPMKTIGEPAVTVPKTRKEYNDFDRKSIEKNFRAKISSMKDVESIQDMHTLFTSIINKLYSLGEIIPRNKLVRKILSVLPGSWENKVNAITEAKDLQKLTIDELIGNLKTYEMKKKKDHEIREPKKEKNQVLKADKNDSSGEDADMAYLTKRFQKMVHRNGVKRNPVSDKRFKRKDAVDNVMKQAIAAWGDSSSESREDDEQGDTSKIAVESEAVEYDSIFALMAKSDDDDNDEGAVKGSCQKWYMDSGCSKYMTGNTNNFLSLKALQGGNLKSIYVADFESLHNGNLTFLSAIDDDVELWHRRLGHASFSLLNKLAKKDLVRGLPKSRFKDHKVCDACVRGKQDKSSFRPKNEIQVKMSHNVISIRSDHGTEFDNAKFDEFYGENGITYNLSAPRTPQQNGVVERKNRTLEYMA